MSTQDEKRTPEENAALWERATARAAARVGLSMTTPAEPRQREGWDAAMQRMAIRSGVTMPAGRAGISEAVAGQDETTPEGRAASWERAMARAAAKRPQPQGS